MHKYIRNSDRNSRLCIKSGNKHRWKDEGHSNRKMVAVWAGHISKDGWLQGSGSVILPRAEPFPGHRCDFRARQITWVSEDISAVASGHGILHAIQCSGVESHREHGASWNRLSVCAFFSLCAVSGGSASCLSCQWLMSHGNEMCSAIWMNVLDLWFLNVLTSLLVLI